MPENQSEAIRRIISHLKGSESVDPILEELDETGIVEIPVATAKEYQRQLAGEGFTPQLDEQFTMISNPNPEFATGHKIGFETYSVTQDQLGNKLYLVGVYGDYTRAIVDTDLSTKPFWPASRDWHSAFITTNPVEVMAEVYRTFEQKVMEIDPKTNQEKLYQQWLEYMNIVTDLKQKIDAMS